MSISVDEVKKVAGLARLGIPEERLDEYSTKLNSILGMMEQLSAIDTKGVEPLSNPLDSVQRLREDVVTETNQRDKYQTIAPEVEEGLYLVPKVIE
ncbi:Asp-tRNA(Asn)/Glu-tRNA(Gln) amidotransferase subunit GatC [Thiolinea disciformis]|uniref:Asp-tRNA(Asn)/Glu-tRNA(Gln) amidotransferase subunit GatC n=1 Tax=Thiolinea disciformis TaxID=125614 RepID=UPI0003628503|nr:Asp-tRNA(Asn)/Glu-tRNA(Gln) amidotransferase subunit GatC [Thiolinea disciformis]